MSPGPRTLEAVSSPHSPGTFAPFSMLILRDALAIFWAPQTTETAKFQVRPQAGCCSVFLGAGCSRCRLRAASSVHPDSRSLYSQNLRKKVSLRIPSWLQVSPAQSVSQEVTQAWKAVSKEQRVIRGNYSGVVPLYSWVPAFLSWPRIFFKSWPYRGVLMKQWLAFCPTRERQLNIRSIKFREPKTYPVWVSR